MSTVHSFSRHVTSPHHSLSQHPPPPTSMPATSASAPSRKPSNQHVSAANPLAVTPAVAISVGPSAHPSPAFSAFPAFPSFSPHATPQLGSLQATPDMAGGSLAQAHIPPITLPPSVASQSAFMSPHVTSPTAMSMSDTANMNKSTNMIRRMSNRLRRRTSTHASHASRDQSAGPTMMRRRSGSNRHATDSGVEFDGYDPEIDLSASEDAIDEALDLSYLGSSPAGLGITATTNSSVGSNATLGPIRPLALEQGSLLTKVTKGKRKPTTFRIDYEAAKLCWHPVDKSRSIYIDDISELLYGKDASHYHDEYNVADHERSRYFSLTYADPNGTRGRIQKTLHLIAPDTQLYKTWIDQLNSLTRMRIEMMNGFVRGGEKSLRTLWISEMRKKGAAEAERLAFAELRMLCRKLNINFSEQTMQSRFSKADTDHTGSLNYLQYVEFMRKLLDRKEVRAIYKRIVPVVDAELDLDGFVRFLTDEQKVDVSANLGRWLRVFEKYSRMSKKGSTSPTTAPSAKPTINSRAFQLLMADSDVFPILAECPAEPKLHRPLNEYFISSSHNTYLPGRQIFAEASVEPYKVALRAGCRCIEIDCWDGPSGKPQVRHGPYTTAVSFSDCISVVNQYAFQTCKYPLTISLEVHCCVEQQLLMATMMKTTFGDKLLVKELHEGSGVLPSPEELRGRILLKVRTADVQEEPSAPADAAPQRRGRGLSSPLSRPIAVPENGMSYGLPLSSPPSTSPPERNGFYMNTPKGSTATTASITPASANSSSEDTDDPPLASHPRKKPKTSKIVPALGELAVYMQGMSFSKKIREGPELQYNHIVSLSEGSFNALASNGRGLEQPTGAVDKHNVNHLMRIYPAGKRVGSTNFNPLGYWRHGVQMAALNWQTYDTYIELNRAMFAGGSDATGYSLKPAAMRPTAKDDDEEEEVPKRKGKKLVRFVIEVISAKQLPRQGSPERDVPTNPFVDLEVFCADERARGVMSGEGGINRTDGGGLTGLGTPLRLRSNTRYDNGHDPQFEQKFSVSVETRYPELIFVRWCVWNALQTDGGSGESTSRTPIGTYTARLSSLQQGYRFLPLRDKNGEQYLFSSLFCHIRVDASIQLDEPGSSVQSLASPNFVPGSPPVEAGKRSFLGRVLNRSPSDKHKKESASLSSTISRTTSVEKAA